MRTRAARGSDGQFSITGNKMWITNGTLDGNTTGDAFLASTPPPWSSDSEIQFFIFELCTMNLRFPGLSKAWMRPTQTLDPRPSTLNPRRPSTLNPPHSTLNPPPSTLNPHPSNLHPRLSILHPQPSILNPQPSTRRSTPKQVIQRAGMDLAFSWWRRETKVSGSASRSRTSAGCGQA